MAQNKVVPPVLVTTPIQHPLVILLAADPQPLGWYRPHLRSSVCHPSFSTLLYGRAKLLFPETTLLRAAFFPVTVLVATKQRRFFCKATSFLKISPIQTRSARPSGAPSYPIKG
jgi:hypothetical protein